MKLIEIANRLDKSKNNEDWVDITKVGEELGIYIDIISQDRLKCYWVGNWYCTDSYVGYRMYFLDDKPVAFSIQNGRKCDEDFNWFSMELAKNTREYLLSLIVEKDNELNIDTCSINEDIGDGFKISFNSQILNKDKVKLNNESVKLVERIKNKPYGIDDMYKVELPNGEIKEVEIKDLEFGFNIVD